MPEEVLIDEPELLLVEISKTGDSGFIMDGTENTATPIKLTSASLTFIPTEGYRYVKTGVDSKGKPVFQMEKIRYIKGEPEIRMDEQIKRGIFPEKGNHILIEKEGTVISRNGDVGLYNYLKDVFYNGSLDKRPDKATELYRTSETNSSTEKVNDDEMMQGNALQFINELFQKQGPGAYLYKEDKIDNLCHLFQIFGDSYASKINMLIFKAKENPKDFLNKAKKMESLTITEVTHGLKLNVIKFQENVLMYVNGKIIHPFSDVKVKWNHDQKIEAAATFFRSPAGNNAYTEFRTALDDAKEKELRK